MTQPTDNPNTEPDFAYLKPFHPVSDDQPVQPHRFNLDYVERVLHFAALTVLIVLSYFTVLMFAPVFIIGYCIGKRLNPLLVCGFWITVGIFAAPPFIFTADITGEGIEWLIFYIAMGIAATLCGMRYNETYYRRYMYLPTVLWLAIIWLSRLTDAILPYMQN